jgi:hypothetical protein
VPVDREALGLTVYESSATTGTAPTTWRMRVLDLATVRREHAQAAAYLRDVGLSGAFWGLA